MEVRKSTNTLGNRKAPIPRPWLLNKSPSRDSSKGQSKIDILDKPRWNISWSKLSSCFCVRDQTNDRRHHDGPFPAFPAIRRDSFSSSSSCALYHVSEKEVISYWCALCKPSIPVSRLTLLSKNRATARFPALPKAIPPPTPPCPLLLLHIMMRVADPKPW
jgi:hypothetical protein